MLKTFQGLPEKTLRDAFGSALQQTNAMLNGVKANLDDLEKKAQTVFTLEQQIKDLKAMLPLYKLIGIEQQNNLSMGAMLSEEQIQSIAKLDPMLRKQMSLDAEISTQKKINALEEQKLGSTSQESLMKLSELEVKRAELTIAMNEATTNSFANMLNSFSQLAGANKKNALLAAQLAKASAIVSTFAGMNKAFEQTGIKGFFSGMAIFAQGMANVAAIETQLQEMKSAATGANFVTTGPQLMLVGDNPGGQERVQVTPLSSPSGPNSPDGSGITINVSAPLVDETVIDAIIPAIEKAQKMNLA
jgi:small-conductance mechanosensitive channel